MSNGKQFETLRFSGNIIHCSRRDQSLSVKYITERLNCVLFSTGYGHIVPMTTWGRIFCIVYALFGIPLTCVVFKLVGTNINDIITKFIGAVKKKFLRSKSQHLKATESALVAIFLDIFTLLLISLVAFFRRKEWTYLESFYFCFVTFSTIGLGDFLPFEDTNVGVTEYLLMAVAIIIFNDVHDALRS